MPGKGDRTRANIVATAAPIFNVKGYAGASIADVLAATGLEKGGLYRHFESKDALAAASFDYAVRLLEERRTSAEIGCETALDRLHAYVDVVAASIADPPLRGGCPILNTAIEADDAHPGLRDRAARAMRDWQSRLVQTVADGVRRGELRPDIDAGAIGSIITSALEGAIMVTALLREPVHMQRIARHLHDVIDNLRALRQTRKRHRP
jgi:AcrR family transcriptional regulator